MTEREILNRLIDALFEVQPEGLDLETLRTFEESGLLTRDEGLVLRTDNGDEFQITIVRSN